MLIVCFIGVIEGFRWTLFQAMLELLDSDYGVIWILLYNMLHIALHIH